MVAHKTQRTPLFGRLLLIGMSMALIGLVISFFGQVRVHSARRAELREEQVELALANETKAELEKQLGYAKSDLAVREWALQNGMALAGETLVILVEPQAEAGPEYQAPAEKGREPGSPRQAWWELLFGSE